MTKARDLANAADVLDDVSATELSYVNGVTSAIQTQLNAKQAVVSGVNDTEIGYLDGVSSAIQTQIDGKTAKSTLTTTGDIYYASSANTPARLGIGSTGNVLTVSGGVPSWAAPAGGGGMTFIQRSSFSNVANTGTTFDGVFNATYETYFINIEKIYSNTAANDLHLQFRYAGPTTETSTYYSINFFANYVASSMSFANVSNGSQIILSDNSGDSADWLTAQLYVNSVGNGSRRPFINGLLYNNNKIAQEVLGGENFTAREYTGFLLKSESANITGTITIFGVNKS